jgi:TPR repeat protein
MSSSAYLRARWLRYGSRFASSLPTSFSRANAIMEINRAKTNFPSFGSFTHFPSRINFSTHSTPRSNPGEVIYQQALEALEQVEKLRDEREKQKAEELHRAIEKAEAKEKEHAHNPKAKNLKGVTVVKTVVKQTRKELKMSTEQQEEEEWEKRAHELLTEAAVTHNHPQSLILLGNGALQTAQKIGWETELTKKESQQLVQQALEFYGKAGLQGAPEGWFNLGQLLWTGCPAIDDDDDKENPTTDTILLVPDMEASMEAFRKAIDLGDPDAMYFVGVHQLGSEGEETAAIGVLEQGLELIESAARQGHGPACYYRAVFYLNGNESLQIPPCSPAEFAYYLDEAVEAGDADALFLRGTSHHEGENGYPLDFAKALSDFLASADAGNADAAVSAGAMLHSGRPGIPQNQSRAFDLYQRAGEMGSIQGWRNVVACYTTGEGVPKSEATAKYIAKTILNE